MASIDQILGTVTRIIDEVVPDPEGRERAKLALQNLMNSHDLQILQTNLSPTGIEAGSADLWTSRARPSFLYMMYVMILCALPVGLVSAFSPRLATTIASGISTYLNGLPEPLYALFGTGYLGYSAMRQWGKVKGSDR
ncbi:hypothetical protein WSK_1854 [Novosphingobium sp. Rr 2-17]|uniref:holin family protein n=1 Tax=Novosphingobium sp. Rr 2-17 TaxID=555793 RepID=UPI0002697B41|nr:holin family protein [Novosphingobium sp. Rr 2-17]EIZ79520.1 hypothetical protein WSK_1854 [Novosphingobium sp. Rr 2-17]